VSVGDKILIVDDEPDIPRLLRSYLLRDGLVPLVAETGAEAIRMTRDDNPALIVLDIMLPDIDGFEVCRRIRRFTDCPIIFLTARTEEADKVLGFGLGGDDYVVKPFSPRELVERIKANLRRSRSANRRDDYHDPSAARFDDDFDDRFGGRFEDRLDGQDDRRAGLERRFREGTAADGALKRAVFDDCVLDLESYQLSVRGNEVQMTSKEFSLLKLLVTNPNRVFTKKQLFESVWEEEWVGGDNTIMVHIHRLRQKIEHDPSAPKRIVTVRGIGYKFVGEVDWVAD
jgi:DNA-binding response OmpR family regulator